jgi:hypothetical protein
MLKISAVLLVDDDPTTNFLNTLTQQQVERVLAQHFAA